TTWKRWRPELTRTSTRGWPGGPPRSRSIASISPMTTWARSGARRATLPASTPPLVSRSAAFCGVRSVRRNSVIQRQGSFIPSALRPSAPPSAVASRQTIPPAPRGALDDSYELGQEAQAVLGEDADGGDADLEHRSP